MPDKYGRPTTADYDALAAAKKEAKERQRGIIASPTATPKNKHSALLRFGIIDRFPQPLPASACSLESMIDVLRSDTTILEFACDYFESTADLVIDAVSHAIVQSPTKDAIVFPAEPDIKQLETFVITLILNFRYGVPIGD